MLDGSVSEASSRVVTTFIHDLRRSPGDHASPAFRGLPAASIVTRSSPGGRGVIVFRNHIEAAVIAFAHANTLGDLITADRLARITRSALDEFGTIDFQAEGKAESRKALARQYREDAEDAYRRLTELAPGPTSRQEDLKAIRLALDEGPLAQG
jgi:hypothetical protein